VALIDAYVQDGEPVVHTCHCHEALKEYGGFRLEAFTAGKKEEQASK
jgi:5'-methylthioadenosine phosphorylase